MWFRSTSRWASKSLAAQCWITDFKDERKWLLTESLKKKRTAIAIEWSHSKLHIIHNLIIIRMMMIPIWENVINLSSSCVIIIYFAINKYIHARFTLLGQIGVPTNYSIVRYGTTLYWRPMCQYNGAYQWHRKMTKNNSKKSFKIEKKLD